jgi:hypothetical protein
LRENLVLQEFHVVYPQPETISHYQKKGKLPDGAILIKELLNAETMPMITGPTVGHATMLKGWFVLVMDTKGRFQASSLRGGWLGVVSVYRRRSEAHRIQGLQDRLHSLSHAVPETSTPKYS